MQTEKIRKEKDKHMRKRTISNTFLRWLLLIVVLAFAMSMIFSWTLQTRLSQHSAANLLRLNIKDVRQDVIDASDANLLALTRVIAHEIDNGAPVNEVGLFSLMNWHNVAEINIINQDGIITGTTRNHTCRIPEL